MHDYDRHALIELVRREALQTGTFKLASGKTASYYLDCRLVTLHPQGANLVAAGMLERIDAMAGTIDAVGGMAIGADPITAAIITREGLRGGQRRGFIVRKEAKGHGGGRQVEGPVIAGDQVVIVEDVITSGGSALAAVTAAREYGLEVRGVIGIIDRLAGGAEAFAAEGLHLQSLLTIRDFGIEPDA